MRPRHTLVAALAAALSLAGPAVPTAGALPRFATGFADGIYETPSLTSYWVDRTTPTGASFVLLPVSWGGVSPSPPARGSDASDPANPAYHWAGIDAAVRGITSHGLQVAITVGGDAGPAWADGRGRPRWAQPGTWKPNSGALASFAKALARRYSGHFNPGDGVLPHVRYYQAWSEPNLYNHITPQWIKVRGRLVPESPIIYRGLLNAFYGAVKSVDRSDLVITGGTAPFGDTAGLRNTRMPPVFFEREMLCLHGQALTRERCPSPAHFDILAHHPYAIGGPKQAAFNPDDASLPDMWKLTRVLRAAQRSGRALPRGRKQVWVTEFSWDSKPPDPHGVPVMKRAGWISETFYVLWHQGVDAIAWYLIRDQPPVPSYAATYQSGLYFLNGQAKPGLEAFRFPFVVERVRGKRWTVWGIAPRGGTVLVQRRSGRSWRTILRFNVRPRGIFTRSITLSSRASFRARVGSETSYPWSAG